MYAMMYINNMNAKTTISITEARKRIFEIAKDAQKPSRYYTLTENGRPKIVIMSAEEFESWMETFEVGRDFPNLKKDIKETDESFENGEYKNWGTLEEMLRQKKYEVSNKDKTKRSKRVK